MGMLATQDKFASNFDGQLVSAETLQVVT